MTQISSFSATSHLGKRVGIVGGGQLGLMMIQAATTLGIEPCFLDADSAACSASAFAARKHAGPLMDPQAIDRLFQGLAGEGNGPDVVTIEIEHVNALALERASAAYNIPVLPTPSVIQLIQDKYRQKCWLSENGFAVPNFFPLAAFLNGPKCPQMDFFVKARRNAYDGHGTTRYFSHDKAVEQFKDQSLAEIDAFYVEESVNFIMELSVMVVISASGSMKSFPVVQTVQQNNICSLVIVPAPTAPEISRKARELGMQIVEKLNPGAGIFAIELFLCAASTASSDPVLLVNEIAPRPHNSGHWTLDACRTSQFEAHLRAISGAPLTSTDMTHPCALMVNIVGNGKEACMEDLWKRLDKWQSWCPGGKLHWYNKKDIRQGRKMGHLTFVSDTLPHLFQDIYPILIDMGYKLSSSNDNDRTSSPIIPPTGTTWQPPCFFPVDIDRIPLCSAATSALSFQGCLPKFPSLPAFISAFPPIVGIIMGSDSDLSTMRKAAVELYRFGVPFEITIVSAHRTPERLVSYGEQAVERGLKVIIAGAGGAAHLPGMMASVTSLPVIGVPVIPSLDVHKASPEQLTMVKSPTASLNGVDALLSIVQMPAGIPVSTVAIGNATNAALLAIRILAASSSNPTGPLKRALTQHCVDMAKSVHSRATNLCTRDYV